MTVLERDETVRDLEACVRLRGNCRGVLRRNPDSVVEQQRLDALDRWIARYQAELLETPITDVGRSTK